MFNFFKKSNNDREIQKVEVTVCDNNELLPDFKKVAVPDIKKYLVDEFEKNTELKREIDSYKKRIENFKVIEQKYDIALVTLEEMNKKVERLENEKKNRNEKIDRQKEMINELNEKIYDLKTTIQYYEDKVKFYKNQEEKIKEKGINEFKSELVETIKSTKGTWSKEKIVKIINNEKEK